MIMPNIIESPTISKEEYRSIAPEYLRCISKYCGNIVIALIEEEDTGSVAKETITEFSLWVIDVVTPRDYKTSGRMRSYIISSFPVVYPTDDHRYPSKLSSILYRNNKRKCGNNSSIGIFTRQHIDFGDVPFEYSKWKDIAFLISTLTRHGTVITNRVCAVVFKDVDGTTAFHSLEIRCDPNTLKILNTLCSSRAIIYEDQSIKRDLCGTDLVALTLKTFGPFN